MLPRSLVFSGGGTKCLAYVSALFELEKARLLTDVTQCYGTSAGALIASMYMLSRSAAAVHTKMYSTDFSRFRDVDLSNILNLTQRWGLDDGTCLLRELENTLETMKPGGKDMRMTDISGLHIIVADLNLHKTVVINNETFPNMPLSHAIRASMTLPFFFRPYIHPESGHVWVDGAVRANFPWHILPTDEDRKQALGFVFNISWVGGPKTFSEYIVSMIHFDEPKKNSDLRTAWPKNILWFPNPGFPAWFTKFTLEDYSVLESSGKTAVDRWINDLAPLSEIHGSHPPSSVHYTRLPSSQTDQIIELLGSHLPFRGLETDPPSLPSPQPPKRQLSSRRWSV